MKVFFNGTDLVVRKKKKETDEKQQKKHRRFPSHSFTRSSLGTSNYCASDDETSGCVQTSDERGRKGASGPRYGGAKGCCCSFFLLSTNDKGCQRKKESKKAILHPPPLSPRARTVFSLNKHTNTPLTRGWTHLGDRHAHGGAGSESRSHFEIG